MTTWDRGQGIQALPVYAGITEISYTDTDVYIRTSNLGYHIMGPWFGETGNLFPNYPANQADIYRFPRSPSIPVDKTATAGGSVGYMVDGVTLFDSRDAFSYDTSQGVDDGPGAAVGVNGDDVWNRDAYINEGATFDNAVALTTPPIPGDLHEVAYNLLIAKDQELNSPAVVPSNVVINVDLPTDAPALLNVTNGNIVRVTSATVGGVAATWDNGDITIAGVSTAAARVDEAGNPDPLSVVIEFDVASSGLVSGLSYDIVITFPGNDGRVITATHQFQIP